MRRLDRVGPHGYEKEREVIDWGDKIRSTRLGSVRSGARHVGGLCTKAAKKGICENVCFSKQRTGIARKPTLGQVNAGIKVVADPSC